jgi:hypothetical protein
VKQADVVDVGGERGDEGADMRPPRSYHTSSWYHSCTG